MFAERRANSHVRAEAPNMRWCLDPLHTSKGVKEGNLLRSRGFTWRLPENED